MLFRSDYQLVCASVVQYAPRDLVKQIRIDVLGAKQCNLCFKPLADVNLLLKLSAQLNGLGLSLGQNSEVA